jgi:hypothetical protein
MTRKEGGGDNLVLFISHHNLVLLDALLLLHLYYETENEN